jgi:tetraacyldisaccharide 4'-kinase
MADLKTFITDMMKSDEKRGGYSPFFFFSILYGNIVRLRNYCYETRIIKSRSLGCPVVSIGNITVGGTGKTPMVIMLAETLEKEGFRPAVLSRGYGGKKRDRTNVVSDGKNILMGIQEAGDEPLLMAQSLGDVPVITGKKRYSTGRYATDHLKADILLLDDAFQHRSLKRDIDIVLLDRGRPFGNGYMLPRGMLRESKSALKRADIIVLTGNDGHEKGSEGTVKTLRKYTDAPVFFASRKPQSVIDGKTGEKQPLDYLKGKKICAFSGIAKPESFGETLASLGGNIVSFVPFPDHHVYREADIEEIGRRAAESSAEIIITTEKDGVKLIDFPRFLQDMYLLRIEMEIIPSNHEFTTLILERLKA